MRQRKLSAEFEPFVEAARKAMIDATAERVDMREGIVSLVGDLRQEIALRRGPIGELTATAQTEGVAQLSASRMWFPSADARPTGTALPICLAISVFDPHHA
jgi:hypothetical protein